MAKHYKWDGNTLRYSVPNAGEATLDVASLPDAVKTAAMLFGIQTAARNATAGLFTEEPESALKRMQQRFATWLKGEWKAAGAGGEGAERKSSMLALAVAEAGGIDAERAAEIISDVISEKVEEAGLSPDEETDKAAIRKIAAAVRTSFAEMPEVAPILTRIKAEAAQKRADEAKVEAEKARAEGKVGSLAEMLNR